MTAEQRADLESMMVDGRRAEIALPVLIKYLQTRRIDIIAELERADISQDRLATLQNRLYVLRSIEDEAQRDIDDGKHARNMMEGG
jgi:hypothetical protein